MNVHHNQSPSNTVSILAKLQQDVLPLENLRLPKHVPKKFDDKAIQSLMRTFHRTGQQIFPILVDDDNIIISGFEIATALRELGATEVGVLRLSNLSSAETKAIMLLLAKIPERSVWDEEAVTAILEEIVIDDPDALDITGFEVAEIDIALGNLDISEKDSSEFDGSNGQHDDDEGLHVATEPIVGLGDIFSLGDHRIICGNCLAEATYLKLLEGKKATVVVTDPPYNIAIENNASGKGKTKHKDFVMGVGEMSFDEFNQFLQSMLVFVNAVLKPGGLVFVFMDRRHLEELFKAVREAGLRLVDLAIWNKLAGGMGGLYRGQYEPCIVAQSGVGPLINNVQLGKFGRYRTNVWDFRGNSSFGKGRSEALTAHPTVKPWPMLAEIILDCTKRGDLVLDPFLGAGSSILAAEKTTRRCFGIELEPKYVEVAIARWEAMTGRKAVHVATGLTLDELRTARTTMPVPQIAEPAESEADK